MGKGSKQRPTDKSKFDDNFDRIFGSREYKSWKADKYIAHYCTAGGHQQIAEGSACNHCNHICK